MTDPVPSKEWMRRWTDLQLAQESTQSVAASALVCELVAEVEQLNRQLDEANESIIKQAFLPPLKVTLLDENSRLLAELRAAVEQLGKPAHEREPPHCVSCSCGMGAPPLTGAIRELWAKAVIVQDGNKGTVSFETAQEADIAFDYLTLIGSIADMRHPKIQALLSQNARLEIERNMIAAIVKDGPDADLYGLSNSARIHTWGCDHHTENTYEGCASCDLEAFSELSSKLTTINARITSLQERIDFAIGELADPYITDAAAEWVRVSVLAVLRGQLYPKGGLVGEALPLEEKTMSECTNYGGVDLTRHPALKEAFRIACLIEACGASPELTKASSAAFDFIRTLDAALSDDGGCRSCEGDQCTTGSECVTLSNPVSS